MVQLERGPRSANRTPLGCQSIGGALLVHPEGEINPQVRAFAGGLAHDPEHTLVVLDLPEDPSAEDWEAVAKLLKRRGRSFRVITGRPSRETAMTVGQLLADRLDRTVLTPDGWVLPAVGGVLFVPEDAGSGWLGFQPRRSSAWARLAPHRRVPRVSRRFPVPDWDDSVPEGSFATTAGGTAEPVPAGVWIRRSDQPEGDREVHRRRLAALLLWQPDRLTAVLGCPGGPHLSVVDIERFWGCVAPDARPLVRFAPYGPVGVPEGSALGQVLADRLGQEITVYAGLPTLGEPGADGPQIRVPATDGTPGPPAFVRELVYRPAGATGSTAPAPVLRGHRPPTDGLAEISPGVYQYAPDAVLEVTQSGLWLRSPAASSDATAVHRVPADLSGMVIHFDAGTPESTQRMRSLADEVRQKLDPVLAEGCRVLPAPKHAAEKNSGAASSQVNGAGAPGTATGVTEPGRVSVAGEPGSAAAGVSKPVRVPGAGETGPAGGVTGASASGAREAGPDGGVGESTPSPAAGEGGPAAGVPGPVPGRPGAGGEAPAVVGGVAGSVGGVSGASGGVTGVEGGMPGPAGEVSRASGGVPAVVGGVAGSVGGVSGASGGVPAPGPGPAVGESGPMGSGPEPAVGPPGSEAEASEPAPVPGVTEPGTAPAASEPASEPAPAGPAASGTPESQPSIPAPVRPRSLRLESAPPPGAAPAESAEATAAGAGIVDPEPVADPAPQAPPRPTPPPAQPSPAPPPAAAPTPTPTPTPAPGPSETPAPVPAPTPPARPKAQPPAVRVQPAPAPEACATPPERGIEQERTWLRRTLKGQYDSAANHVARVLSESPGLRGSSRQSADEVVTDLVAVRLYLSGGTDRIDTAVRSATIGPHVPLARCVASGLRRLPSYRGATLLRTTLSEAEWQWYGKRRLVTEWAFCSALTTAHPEMAGDVDVLIWSMTARRTALLDATVPDRVLYLPGTSFKVLGVRDEERRVLLLRELTGPEIGADGTVDLRRLPLDDIAMTGLEQAATEWQDAKPAVRLPATVVTALRNPPGLIVTGRSAAPRTADAAPPRKGTTP
ncbi:hypothetical protein OHT68_10160 [Streptomyces canus]|uniref:hypothetical protein n=1 Tax=Streptomyces canus TaxID=58343 RepID=UPI002E2E3E4D|nr:hypothetical protein [Streptomyces canus]